MILVGTLELHQQIHYFLQTRESYPPSKLSWPQILYRTSALTATT